MRYQIVFDVTSTASKDILQEALDSLLEHRDIARLIREQTGGQIEIHTCELEQITKIK